MKKVDLSSLDLDAYFKTINATKIREELFDPKYQNIVNNLEEIIKENDLTKYLNLCVGYLPEELKEIEEAFNYTGHRKKTDFMEHFKKLGIKSCPFCNNNYVYFYEQGAKKYNTLATLEHYYPKAKYPHLSLSFYNLIPSCSTCNSKFKGKEEHVGKIVHPYYEDFDDQVEFRISIDSFGSDKGVELEVNLKTSNPRCETSIERFHLDKIYRQHNDIAKEIWNKAQVYTESQIEELYQSFYKDLGYTREEVRNFIFCNYLDKKDINRRNHAKLTQDILKQFELTDSSD